MPLPAHTDLQYYLEEPHWSNHEKLLKKLELNQRPNYPLALLPPLQFPRIVSQLSAFTIHPKPESGKDLYAANMEDKRILKKFVVPAANKKDIREELSKLGFNHCNLFRDLDSLSKTIVEEYLNDLETGGWTG